MTRANRGEKPPKPWPEFPLTAHPCGQWVKKIHGKLYYFGPWADHSGALAEYRRQRDTLHGGGGVTDDAGGTTIDQLCRDFIRSRQSLLAAGELSARTLADYEATTQRFEKFFGPSRPVASLTPADFSRYMESWPDSWGAQRIANEVTRLSPVFRFGLTEGLLSSPVKVGVGFRRPSAKRLRTERAGRDAKFFGADEIRMLLDSASVQMKAMILLGINAGYGNADCARLTWGMIDWGDQWLADPRHKTGVWRAAWLWPETIAALRDVESLAAKRTRVPEEYADLVFLTRYRRPWWVDGESGDAVSLEMAKLRKAVGVFRRGVGFYSLRHVTQTIGEQLPGVNPVTIKVVMGHADHTISAKYREQYDRSQVKAVCQHVREWLFPEKIEK